MTEVAPDTLPPVEQIFIAWDDLRWTWHKGSYFVGIHGVNSFGYEADMGGGFLLHFIYNHGDRFLDIEGLRTLIHMQVTSYIVRLVYDGKVVQGASYSEPADARYVYKPPIPFFERASQLKEIFNKIREKVEPPSVG